MAAGHDMDPSDHGSGAAGPWRPRDVIAVLLAQLAGLSVAYLAAWIAFFNLPAEALIAEPNSATQRVIGAAAALVGALTLPGGCWEAWRRRRHPLPAAVGAIVGIAALVLALAWALEVEA